MLTLFPTANGLRPVAPRNRGSLLFASLVTVVAFLLLLGTLVRATAVPVLVASAPLAAEPITFVMPRQPSTIVPTTPRVPVSASARALVAMPAAPAPPRDTGSASPSRPFTSAAPLLAEAPIDSPVATPSTRLMPSRGSASWAPAVAFDPFRVRTAPSPEMRDSLLRDLRDTIAVVARTLVMTGARRDALVKEGMLRNKVSGRTLLDPGIGDGTYHGGIGGIPVPFLEPGPSRAQRIRDSISFAENRARLQRLGARAESLRASRGEPIRKQD